MFDDKTSPGMSRARRGCTTASSDADPGLGEPERSRCRIVCRSRMTARGDELLTWARSPAPLSSHAEGRGGRDASDVYKR